MKALTDWAAGFKGRPLSLFFLILGAVFALLAVTSGFALPVLKGIVAEPNYRLFALFLGLACLITGCALYYLPKGQMQGDWVPDDLTRSFVDRRDALGEKQRVLLGILEDETTPTRQVLLEAIKEHFNRKSGDNHGAAEVYYRLEQLRLLGFVERQTVAAGGPHSYRVTPHYWQQLQGVLLPVPRSTLARTEGKR
jgi:hypothetical protein